MKYQCLIVDDEPVAQQILEKYINQIEALHLVTKCSNAFEAMNILHQERVDILFLDIVYLFKISNRATIFERCIFAI